MTNIIVGSNISSQDIEVIIFNIAHSFPSGRFTVDGIMEQVKEHKLCISRKDVIEVVSNWLECGSVFDNFTDFVINKSLDFS